mgnify:CR=1 FL=1
MYIVELFTGLWWCVYEYFVFLNCWMVWIVEWMYCYSTIYIVVVSSAWENFWSLVMYNFIYFWIILSIFDTTNTIRLGRDLAIFRWNPSKPDHVRRFRWQKFKSPVFFPQNKMLTNFKLYDVSYAHITFGLTNIRLCYYFVIIYDIWDIRCAIEFTYLFFFFL